MPTIVKTASSDGFRSLIPIPIFWKLNSDQFTLLADFCTYHGSQDKNLTGSRDFVRVGDIGKVMVRLVNVSFR